jgi:hypothetical protein
MDHPVTEGDKYRYLVLQFGRWTHCYVKIIVAKSKVLKTGWFYSKKNLAEFSKEGYGSKRAVLPMMMMVI